MGRDCDLLESLGPEASIWPKNGRDASARATRTRKATKGLLGGRVHLARPPDRRCLMRKPNYASSAPSETG